MRKALLLLTALTLVGCAPSGTSTSPLYVHMADNMYYDENGTYSANGMPIPISPYGKQPAIEYMDVDLPYTLSSNGVPHSYASTTTNSLAYVTSLKKAGYVVEVVSETPNCLTLLLHGKDELKIYITKGVMRIYARTKTTGAKG